MQLYERELGFDAATISGNTTKLKDFTADVNLAFDDYVGIAIRSSGTWQFDDSNQTDYQIITTNLVSGQRSYVFTTDESGNLILDIQKVLIASDDGKYHEISAVDQQGDDTAGFWDGNNATGTPTRYDKTANGIFLDPIPGYNETNGLKIYINREASYFVSTDDTKKPGVPGIHHEYFYLKPAFVYARRKNLAVFPRLRDEIMKWEGDDSQNIKGKIATYFSERPRDERRRLQVTQQNNR